MEANKWINDILTSTDGIIKVTPDAVLFTKIQHRIYNQNTISTRWIWIAAASFTILFSLNVRLIFSNKKNAEVNTETIASSISINNQLY
jgi:hypothetical protein